jgi:hypothetical protein
LALSLGNSQHSKLQIKDAQLCILLNKDTDNYQYKHGNITAYLQYRGFQFV